MNLSAVSKCSEWICGLTNGFICFPDNTCTHSKSSQLMQTVVPHSGYPAALCVQLGLYRTSHSFISCFTASYCIVLHYCMAYWRFILVSNWCSAPHCCCTVVLGEAHFHSLYTRTAQNGFRFKSNWLKYTIFPRPSFKSCFKKERICRPVQTHFKNMVAT